MIRDEKRSEVEEELRKQVDVLMREELDLLKIVRKQSYFLLYGKLYDCRFRQWKETRVRKVRSARSGNA